MAEPRNMLMDLRLSRQKRDERMGRDTPFGQAGAEFAANALPIYSGIGPMVNALSDPTLANVTNAGVRVPLSLLGIVPGMLPAAATAGMLGMGEAVRRDISPEIVGEAQAQSRGKARGNSRSEQIQVDLVQLPGLTPEQNAEYNGLQVRLRRADFGSAADRRSVEARSRELRELSDRFAKGRNESAQQEYNTAVSRAETAKNDILSRRPKQFAETEVGKIYDSLGIVAPGVMAAGMGALTGLASGGRALPAVVGGLTGAVAANYPLGHELLFAPAANPERQAFEAYARELPPDHPRKAEWQNYAQGLPEENPARRAAVAEFFDPSGLAKRSGFGAVEGALGGLAGGEVVNVARKARDAAGGAIGGVADWVRQGGRSSNVPPNPLSNTQGRYPGPGTPERNYIRDEYRSAVNDAGGPLSPRQASGIIQGYAEQAGGSLPSMTGRIGQTNKGYTDFLNRNGRPPVSREDWNQVYRDTGTLAIPAAAGAGAAAASMMPGQAEAQTVDEFERELAAVRALLDGLAQQSVPQQFPAEPFANAVPSVPINNLMAYRR